MLPPAVDVELSGPFPDIPSDATFAAGFGEFLRLVEAHFGRKPVIYAPADAHARLLAGRFLDRPFWCRSIGRAPALADRDWTFWQHDDAGSCPGIAGSVDRDVFAGSRSAFGAFVGTADA